MPDLIAQGVEPQHRWRRPLPPGEAVVLGRSAGMWTIPWDPHVSRRHVRLLWTGQGLDVSQLPEARNPVFFRGAEQTQFTLQPGEHFVIGQTTFILADQRVSITADAPQPVQQRSYSPQYLKQVRFRNPDHRIEVLSRLPEVISGAADDLELFVRLVNMVLTGVPRADAVAVVAADKGSISQLDPQQGTTSLPAANAGRTPPPRPPASPVRVLHWDQRLLLGDDFQPSQGLILESLAQRQSVLHVWRGADAVGPQRFTESDAFDWAFCTPVPGNACAGWGLYVAGRFNIESPNVSDSDPSDLREDVKFTELVAATLSSLRQMRLLQRRHASLSQFFSPVVLETLSGEDPEVVLAPRETEVSVLFCDLRGFSLETERHANDLLGLLHRVSRALGVVTRQIRHHGGVVGDLQGDAAMGFWGWPLPQDDAVERTCRAALAVTTELQATAGFRAGMGIATGRAVAGKIGTADQVKVTVFGPVVNLASRLEGMTKILRAAVLLDEATAEAVRRLVPPEVARVRRLAVVRPFGLDTPLEVSELLPPAAEYPTLSDQHLASYESALAAFLSGDWPKAFDLLHQIPTEDRAKDFLTVYIAQHNRTPPPTFNGVIPLENK
jgi:adenylate cyclase